MNARSDYSFCIFIGVVCAVIAIAVNWHIKESKCQKKHNVADCARVEILFVPAEIKQ